MKALASFILRGPSQAILVAVGTAVLAMMLPPLSVISGAVVALVTLRAGIPGGIVMLGSAAFVALLAYVSLGNRDRRGVFGRDLVTHVDIGVGAAGDAFPGLGDLGGRRIGYCRCADDVCPGR